MVEASVPCVSTVGSGSNGANRRLPLLGQAAAGHPVGQARYGEDRAGRRGRLQSQAFDGISEISVQEQCPDNNSHTHGFTFLILFASNRIQHFKAKCFWVQMGYGFQNRPGESSLSPRVTELKGYLQPSPRSAKASLLSSYMLRPYPKSNP